MSGPMREWRAPPRSGGGPGPDLRAYAWIVHGLYAAALLTGVTAVPGVIVAYLKRRDAAGTIYESHFAYAIRSFWIGLLLTLAGAALCLVLVGFLVLALVGIWWLVRIIRPIMALLEDRAIVHPSGFF